MRETKKLRRPIVMLNVTEDCQLRCKHCYNTSGGLKHATPADLQERTVKVARAAGAINFTGGEPFLVPELPELLKISHAHGVDNIITSNGLLVDEALLDQITPHVYMLKIGMMGATPTTNDFIRGRGHFKTAIKALDLMAGYDFVSCMKVSLDRHNMDEIEAFCQVALEHGVDQLVFGQLVNQGRASKMLQDLLLTHLDLQQVQEELTRVKEKYWGQLKIAKHCTLSGLCEEAGHFYTVTSTGAMAPCLMREDLAGGNIATVDVKEMMAMVDFFGRGRHHSSVKDLEVAKPRFWSGNTIR